ncbi:uncharacterized protein GLRG_05522 [Colletotrichum graminicola M1.001]|uniref:Uncharacterized protein n=1 Tax=Colletotrichum graminicola (strain M1.001 / M2 / FGSC 10212) TaxID=645133 RepID=E3QHP0_COLGM|nr:uncharacterized protein GLRG_05522 [Colletotrichum graminicola M1.001]EFQ30378.1 hypothetical protein GLRG_05522 [Colletotrichum graminicola M1.001]
MAFQRFSAVLLLLSGALIGFGNQAYALDYDKDEATGRWVFKVYGDGYGAKDEQGEQSSLDTIMVNTKTKRLTVVKAMNGLDKTEPRLKMRQVLKECWTMTGLQTSELKEVLGYKIENTDMKAALADCRNSMSLGPSDSFVLSTTDTDPAKKTCWNRLDRTIFSASIRGTVADFGINKKLMQVKVDNGGPWDYIYYEFS